MSHIRIILGAKLDCLGEAFNVADEARALKETAFDADDRLIASQFDDTILFAVEIHQLLENIQTWATLVCDNGTEYSPKQLCEIIQDYKASLEMLMQ